MNTTDPLTNNKDETVFILTWNGSVLGVYGDKETPKNVVEEWTHQRQIYAKITPWKIQHHEENSKNP
jgi:predicted lipid-binding transport protein (Tim44 family)